VNGISMPAFGTEKLYAVAQRALHGSIYRARLCSSVFAHTLSPRLKKPSRLPILSIYLHRFLGSQRLQPSGCPEVPATSLTHVKRDARSWSPKALRPCLVDRQQLGEWKDGSGKLSVFCLLRCQLRKIRLCPSILLPLSRPQRRYSSA
jgi:hypothetical protein